jgi:hypothetical protein
VPVLRKLRGMALTPIVRTATAVTTIFTPDNTGSDQYNGIIVYVRTTVFASGTGYKVLLRGYSPGDPSTPYQINAGSAAITGVGLYILQMYPSLQTTPPPGSNISETIAGILPGMFDIQVVHLDGSPYTYSVSYELIP